jgi:hypothetical protein
MLEENLLIAFLTLDTSHILGTLPSIFKAINSSRAIIEKGKRYMIPPCWEDSQRSSDPNTEIVFLEKGKGGPEGCSYIYLLHMFVFCSSHRNIIILKGLAHNRYAVGV